MGMFRKFAHGEGSLSSLALSSSAAWETKKDNTAHTAGTEARTTAMVHTSVSLSCPMRKRPERITTPRESSHLS